MISYPSLYMHTCITYASIYNVTIPSHSIRGKCGPYLGVGHRRGEDSAEAFGQTASLPIFAGERTTQNLPKEPPSVQGGSKSSGIFFPSFHHLMKMAFTSWKSDRIHPWTNVSHFLGTKILYGFFLTGTKDKIEKQIFRSSKPRNGLKIGT